MMTTMTLDQAKDHLADLLAKAADGEQVVIVRDDGRTFTVVPAPAAPRNEHEPVERAPSEMWTANDASDTSTSDATPTQRRPRSESYGILKGKIRLAPDFDDTPEGFEPYLGDDDVKDT